MNIEDLTIKQARELATLFGGGENQKTFTPHIGKKCIIRTYASGVHFGTLVSRSGREVTLENARRIWSFDVKEHGISLSEVAMYGPTGGNTRICCEVTTMDILDALEIIPATHEAIKVIEAAETYVP